MRITPLIICAALALPTVTFAQGGNRGGGGGGAPSARPAKANEIEDLNPARMLVDKRKKIGLADSTVNQLKALDKKIAERNKSLIQQYDSVRRDMRFPNAAPSGGEMAAKMGASARGRVPVGGTVTGGGGAEQSPEEAAKLRAQMQALGEIVAKLRDRRPADLAESLALLSPDQAEKAKEFVNQQNDEFEKVLPNRGGRGGAPPE